MLLVFIVLVSSYIVSATEPERDYFKPSVLASTAQTPPDPNLVSADDFIFRGLSRPGEHIKHAFADQFPGINTLGIATACLVFGLNGIIPPHIHHRGMGMLVVVQGTLYVGFVTSNQLNNQFFAKVWNKGDVFVFLQGMIHFQLSVGQTEAIAFAFLSSQNPGLITIANVFGANPSISANVLSKAFRVDEHLFNNLQGQKWFDNH